MHAAIPREPPHFIVAIDDVETTVGDSAHFYCQAGGIPVPELLWYRAGKQITDNNRFLVHHNEFDKYTDSTLIVVDVKSEDSGSYHAVATNQYGKSLCEAELIGRFSLVYKPMLLDQSGNSLKSIDQSGSSFEIY